jgi:lysophospholipase L1-like esterase
MILNFIFYFFLSIFLCEILVKILYFLKENKISFLYYIDIKNNSFKPHPYFFYTKKENNNGLYPTNNYGYVGKKNFFKKKKKKDLRIYIIGGSTVEDLSRKNDPNSHWPSFLEEILKNKCQKNIECINAGCAGYTSAESLSEFAFKGLDFSPDFLIIYHNINDVWTAQLQKNYKNDYSHSRIVKNFYPLITKLPQIPFWFSYQFFLKILLDNFQGKGLLNIISNPPWAVDYRVRKEKLYSFKRNIKNIIKISKGWNCIPIIIRFELDWKKKICPPGFVGNKKKVIKMFKYYINENNKTLQRISKEENVYYFNLGPFSKNFFTNDGYHLSESGMRFIAEKLSNKLIKIILKNKIV